MSGSVDITGAPANNKAVTVHAIETGGHWTSLAVGGGLIAKGAYTAFGTGGSYAAACYCIPFAGLVVGALAGGFISDKLGCDEKMVNWLGELQLAVPGPNPAVRGDKIAHSHAFAGAVGGLIAGAVIGAVVGLGVAAIIASGGLATPLVIGAAAGLSAGLSGGFIH
ncbi:MAG: hypothetical protein VB050_00535, partial [Geobacteraceae bacterium]|nr:hypothetical protein [Geobacteraceae bacterium]